MKTQQLGPFLGVNNRLPDFALQPDAKSTAAYLRSATNVEINDALVVQRRKATALLVPMIGAHSLSPKQDYLVRGSVIYSITLPAYTETMFKLLTSNEPISWCSVGADLYYSNGTDSGRITAGIWYPIGLPTTESPTLALIGGSLEPGWYQIAVSYANATTGEEGGVGPSSNYQLSSLGGLRVNLPAAVSGATHVNVYLSATNGTLPYLAASVPVGDTTIDLIDLSTGREAQQRFEAPLPAGRLFMSNGRLCSISGDTVNIGLPFRPGYCLPVSDYIKFPAPVSVAIESQNGTYVVAQKTHWFPGGDLSNVEALLVDVLPYGAVLGTEFSLDDKMVVGWFSDKGVVFADTQGQVTPAMADSVAQTPPSFGQSVVFTDGGFRRVVSCGWCVNTSNKATTQFTDWELTSISGNYATAADGIYQLDAEGLVDWTIGLGKMNFGTETLKHLPAVYLGVSSEDTISIRVRTPGDEDYTYDAIAYSGDLAVQRVDPGRGLRANWFDLTVQGNCNFNLASMSITPMASTRRI